MTDKTSRKTFKQVCTCQNCGNEAEMIITCTLEPEEEAAIEHAPHTKVPKTALKKRTGQAICTHCGNEAEILVDFLPEVVSKQHD